jgi:hypothetical protein
MLMELDLICIGLCKVWPGSWPVLRFVKAFFTFLERNEINNTVSRGFEQKSRLGPDSSGLPGLSGLRRKQGL